MSHKKDARRICVKYEIFLQGVDVVSDVLLKDMSVIKYVKDLRLVMFVWGEECNDKATIQKMRDNKVDGIIYDR